MELLNPYFVQQAGADFLTTRRASAAKERNGPPVGVTPLLAAVAGAFARGAAAVERWARGSTDAPVQRHFPAQ